MFIGSYYGQEFFSIKYKEMIEANQYVLPLFCLECDSKLVDKKPTVTKNLNTHLIEGI